MLFVCIIMHTPPNASSNTVNNTVIFIGIPAFLIMASVNAFKEKNIPLSQKVYSLPGADFSDISNKYDINKPAVLLCEKCIIIFTMTEKIIT